MVERISLAMLSMLVCLTTARAAGVRVERVPNSGLQPQAAVDATGTLHLIYLKGDPARSDIFYVRSSDGAKTWSDAIRVNSAPGAAIAMGTVRGAHLALGRNGHVHVAWMGSQSAEPKGPANSTPMLYAQLAPGAKSFTPQRNVIAAHPGLDGGGSIAADDRGNVFIAWHAPTTKGGDEADRRVWVAQSTDDGKTFAPESPLSPDPTGACGCCGMRLFAANGRVFALYRSATEHVHRDIYLLSTTVPLGQANAPRAASEKVSPMNAGKCIMSTAAFGSRGTTTIAAWENDGQIEFGRIDAKTGKIDRATPIPGKGGNRKYPSIAVADDGRFLIAWAEGTGWNKGGSVAWQVFDAEGKPLAGEKGSAAGLPAWGSPAAVVGTGRSRDWLVLY